MAGFVALTLAKYSKSIEVKLSHSTEHYMRLYIEVNKGSKKSDECLKNIGYISHCKHCLYREQNKGLATSTPDICPECGEKINSGRTFMAWRYSECRIYFKND